MKHCINSFMVNETLKQLCIQINSGRIRANNALLIKHIEDIDILEKLKELNAGQFAWHIVHNTWKIPKCNVCKKDNHWISFKRNYSNNCSKQCSYLNPKRQERIQETILEKYDDGLKNQEILKKKKDTNFKKYGVENPNQSINVKLQKEITMLERWGVSNPSQHIEIQQRKMDTNQAKRGVDWVSQDPTVRELQKQTSLIRYGSESSLGNSMVRMQGLETMMQRYGVEYAQQNIMIRHNTANTIIEKLESKFLFQHNVIILK